MSGPARHDRMARQFADRAVGAAPYVGGVLRMWWDGRPPTDFECVACVGLVAFYIALSIWQGYKAK